MKQQRYWVALFNKMASVPELSGNLPASLGSKLPAPDTTKVLPRIRIRLVMLCDRATVLARSDRSMTIRRAG